MTNEEIRAAALAAAAEMNVPGSNPEYVMRVAVAFEKYIRIGEVTDVQEWV
jgi:hypothetical protein